MTEARWRIRTDHSSAVPDFVLARLCVFHLAASGGGVQVKALPFSRCVFAPELLYGTKKSLQTNKGRRSAERRVVRDRSALSKRHRWAGSRRAPLLADALAFRRSTAALARFSGLAQSGPALHGSANGCNSVRHPGSQLLADRRRGRPGEFPNRPNTVCETAPGAPRLLHLRDRIRNVPFDKQAAAFYLARKHCQGIYSKVRVR